MRGERGMVGGGEEVERKWERGLVSGREKVQGGAALSETASG